MSIDLLEPFQAQDMDSTSTPQYFGFLKRTGEWYIMSVTDTAIRYAKGNKDYQTSWTNRASLEYGYWS